MKVNGKQIRDMVLDMSDLAMETSTKENTSKAKSKAKAATNGHQANSTKDNGSTDRKTATASGKAWRMITMSASGKRISLKALESISGATVTSTKVNGLLASDTDKEAISSPSETPTWASILGDKRMAMGNTAGRTDTHIVDSLAKVRKKGKVIGSRARTHSATSILAPTQTTRNTGMENSLGAQGADTRANTSKISRKATEKCTGLMDRSTEDSGMKVFKPV
jgi:hypothetical protein